MQTTKHFIVMLLCVLMSAPATLAQNPQRNGQTDNAVSQDVLIIIEQQQVRFTSRSAVEWMQLQVFNQAGEAVFDSNPVAAGELNWPFQNANGEAIKSGLYAYTLSLKEQGAEAARVRRGHFIVDWAQDRDGADKLWVTSQNSSGVGAELTVLRDENAVVAGTITSSERSLEARGENQKRESDDRGVEAEAQHQTQTSKTTAAAITAGTAGQIAKFTSASDLGNSVMTEVNGNVGIGTTNPSARLEVVHPATQVRFGSSAADNGGYLISVLPSQAIISGGGSWNGANWIAKDRVASLTAHQNGVIQFFTNGNLAVGSPFGPLERMRIDLNGNVGIGTGSFLQSKLTIEGQDALTAQGYEPFLTLRDSNDFFSQGSHRIQSAHGDLSFVEGARVRNDCGSGRICAEPYTYKYFPRIVIKSDGNVGIGTTAPNHQLSLGAGPKWTANGWGGSLELENGAAIGWKANSLGQRFGMGHTNGGFYIFRTTSDPGTAVSPASYDLSISDTGVTSVRVLQITGGADFAENFNVNEAPAGSESVEAKIEAGMVVSIDPANPGGLQLSTRAYDYQVAGIISGAGGVKPGMTMSQEGTLAHGQHPVALSGRVYCWADASNGPIKPGDLLTTSDTPGHAMKVTDRVKSQGAIIGKAMTGLKEGKGLVLALVTLQ